MSETLWVSGVQSVLHRLWVALCAHPPGSASCRLEAVGTGQAPAGAGDGAPPRSWVPVDGSGSLLLPCPRTDPHLLARKRAH